MADQFATGSVIAVREVNRNMDVNGELKDVDSVWIYKVVDGKIHYMHFFSPDENANEAMNSLS